MTETVVAPVVAVTVLEDRASVTRRGKVAVRVGQQRIVIERVSPVLADKTLIAACNGARVLDVRCERYIAPWREQPTCDTAALRAEKLRLETARDIAVAQLQAARVTTDALAELSLAALHDLAIAATRGLPPEGAAPQLVELDANEAAARVRRVDAELEVQDLVAMLARLEELLARAEAKAGEEAARLLIDVLAETAADVTISASYVVPGAAWRPYHRAMLARESGRVEWQTTACVWQATGEAWTDAELTFSLERPSLGVDAPDLTDDELRTRRRPEIVVEMRDQEQQTTGLGASGPLQVPGIDDGGLGLELVASKPVTVASDGTPHRIVVGGFTAQAQLSLVAIPLRSPWVHVRARIVHAGTTALLAGPVDLIMSSGYVGRGEIGFVAPGEKFYLGFGPESDVRVHRNETRERDDAGMLGGWNVQTVRVAVRLSNLGVQRREIVVTERIPISEIEQVNVTASAADAYLLDDDDHPGGEEITQVTARALDERGLVTWSVELPALGRRAVTLEYKVKSQRGVAGV